MNRVVVCFTLPIYLNFCAAIGLVSAATINLPAIASGWYDILGTHDPLIPNYVVGDLTT